MKLTTATETEKQW